MRKSHYECAPMSSAGISIIISAVINTILSANNARPWRALRERVPRQHAPGDQREGRFGKRAKNSADSRARRWLK